MSGLLGPEPKECSCQSGEIREAEYDGHGCFLFYCCYKCRERKLSKFRPDIKERYECDEPIEPEE